MRNALAIFFLLFSGLVQEGRPSEDLARQPSQSPVDRQAIRAEYTADPVYMQAIGFGQNADVVQNIPQVGPPKNAGGGAAREGDSWPRVAVANLQAAIDNTADGWLLSHPDPFNLKPKRPDLAKNVERMAGTLKIRNKMLQVLAQYAEANDYSIVLDASNALAPVLWAAPDADITKELTIAYDSQKVARAASVSGAGKIGFMSKKEALFQLNKLEVFHIQEELHGNMHEVLDKYAKDNGYTLILGLSNPKALPWADSLGDVTHDWVRVHHGQTSAGLADVFPSIAPKKVGVVRIADTVDAGRKPIMLAKYAKDNGYLIVLDTSDPQTPVLYAAKGTDITQPLQTFALGALTSPSPNTSAGSRELRPSNDKPALATKSAFSALIVGINHYPQIPGRDLTTAVSDARAVEEVLRTKYGFKTRLLKEAEATRSGILKTLNEYRNSLDENASLLIYYAGHGQFEPESDKAYWLPADAERDNPANWIIADDITAAIRAIPARHVLVVSDSCFSGGIARDIGPPMVTSPQRDTFLKKMAAGRSRSLLSSGGVEPVEDQGGRNNHSIFATAFLDGLKRMESSSFTADELFTSFIRIPVAGNSQQVPQYNIIRNSGAGSGDFVFVKQGAATAAPR